MARVNLGERYGNLGTILFELVVMLYKKILASPELIRSETFLKIGGALIYRDVRDLPIIYTKRIQTKEQVSCAIIVPIGIDFCGSFRSPDMFDPVMIPVQK